MTAVETVGSPPIAGLFRLTILFLRTFGTAPGDWKADNIPLGNNGRTMQIESPLAVPAIVYFPANLSRTALFCGVSILTRTLGG